MTRTHAYMCDDCGEIELEIDGLGTGKSLAYGEIYQNNEPDEKVVGEWRIIGRVNPEDSAVIDVEHYCPDCEADHAL